MPINFFKAKRDETGGVILKPRQCLPGGRKRGSYFQYMGTLAQGCPYIEPHRRKKILMAKAHKPMNVHP